VRFLTALVSFSISDGLISRASFSCANENNSDVKFGALFSSFYANAPAHDLTRRPKAMVVDLDPAIVDAANSIRL
jgi:hypothetical protein